MSEFFHSTYILLVTKSFYFYNSYRTVRINVENLHNFTKVFLIFIGKQHLVLVLVSFFINFNLLFNKSGCHTTRQTVSIERAVNQSVIGISYSAIAIEHGMYSPCIGGVTVLYLYVFIFCFQKSKLFNSKNFSE